MHPPLRNINNLMVLLYGELPGQLIIQFSNRCNADCPQCGMRRSEGISRATQGPDQKAERRSRQRHRRLHPLAECLTWQKPPAWSHQ